MYVFFFFQAEDGIRDLVRSRGLGDVYKRQGKSLAVDEHAHHLCMGHGVSRHPNDQAIEEQYTNCLLYTSDAADDLLCVDLGGRRIIKKKKKQQDTTDRNYTQIYNPYTI